MRCPDCNKSMLILEYSGIEIDWCPICRGCWLDEGELEQILDGRDTAIRLVEWAGGQEEKRRCPRCGEILHAVGLSKNGPQVAACPAACGLWFDHGKLREAVRTKLPDGQASSVLETLTAMFGETEIPEKE